MSSLNFENIHYASYAYIAFKDAKTVHNGLVGVFGLHHTPNLKNIYLWFEDRRRDWFSRSHYRKALNLAVHAQL